MIFANPLGLFALLGIPAVLAIHFFQRTAKEVPISTLFLLEHVRRQSPAGRRFERLSLSVPLWLQLFVVLLLAWLLAEPRFPQTGRVQRVAVVLDSSASMSVFQKDSIGKLRELLPSLRKPGNALEITALLSIPETPRIYSGTSIEEFLAALQRDWHPTASTTDPFSSLRLARSLVSSHGIVLYVTDTPPTTPPPFDARTLSLGRSLDNVGITGVSFEKDGEILVWKALVKNFGKTPATRNWQLVTAKGASSPRAITLPPGAIATVQSAFPVADRNVRLVLSPDDFPLDDVLPLVAPAPKSLAIFAGISPALEPVFSRITRSLESVTASADAASSDLQIVSYQPLDPRLPEGNAIVFTSEETRTGAWLKGGIVSTNHPLVANLNWKPLLVREAVSLDSGPADLVLVRQENRPLIYLRHLSNGASQLVFNFDPTLSNIDQQPAFIVLIHRFVETLRKNKVAPLAGNFETHQPLNVTTSAALPVIVTASHPAGESIPAPSATFPISLSVPGFLTVAQNGTNLLTAAIHFGDPRESDFSACAPVAADVIDANAALERNTVPDRWKSLWLLLLIVALVLSWYFVTPRNDRSEV